MIHADNYQATFRLQDFVIGIHCDESMIFSMTYFPSNFSEISAKNLLAAECLAQLTFYFKSRGKHRFDLPLSLAKTPFSRRVRKILMDIPPGEVKTYGAVAKLLGNTSSRAVGGACRANTIALIVPCHRVVSATGIGGFMGDDGHSHVFIKKFLLQHEGWHG